MAYADLNGQIPKPKVATSWRDIFSGTTQMVTKCSINEPGDWGGVNIATPCKFEGPVSLAHICVVLRSSTDYFKFEARGAAASIVLYQFAPGSRFQEILNDYMTSGIPLNPESVLTGVTATQTNESSHTTNQTTSSQSVETVSFGEDLGGSQFNASAFLAAS